MGFFDDITDQEGFFRRGAKGGFFQISPEASFAYKQRFINQGKVFTGDTVRNVSFSMAFGVSELLTIAVDQMSGELKDAVKIFLAASKNSVFNKTGWANAMNIVGQEAQARVLDAYDDQKKGPRYRVGPGQNRYAGGVFRRALASRSFYEPSRDGLNFINTGMLDAKAKQWARYNYGALPKAVRGNRQFPVNLFGQSVGTLGLTRRPSPSFRLPRGVMLGANNVPLTAEQRGPRARGSQDRFYTVYQFNQSPFARNLTKKTRSPDRGFFGPVESRGIVGRRIFDAGVEYIAAALPNQVERLMENAFRDAAYGAKGGGFGGLGRQGLQPTRAEHYLGRLINRF